MLLNRIITCRESDLPLIVAIDLQPMAPIEGVIQVQGDITNARTAEVVSILHPTLVEVNHSLLKYPFSLPFKSCSLFIFFSMHFVESL